MSNPPSFEFSNQFKIDMTFDHIIQLLITWIIDSSIAVYDEVYPQHEGVMYQLYNTIEALKPYSSHINTSLIYTYAKYLPSSSYTTPIQYNPLMTDTLSSYDIHNILDIFYHISCMACERICSKLNVEVSDLVSKGLATRTIDMLRDSSSGADLDRYRLYRFNTKLSKLFKASKLEYYTPMLHIQVTTQEIDRMVNMVYYILYDIIFRLYNQHSNLIENLYNLTSIVYFYIIISLRTVFGHATTLCNTTDEAAITKVLYDTKADFSQLSNMLHIFEVYKRLVDYIDEYTMVHPVPSNAKDICSNNLVQFKAFSACINAYINSIHNAYHDKNVITTITNPTRVALKYTSNISIIDLTTLSTSIHPYHKWATSGCPYSESGLHAIKSAIIHARNLPDSGDYETYVMQLFNNWSSSMYSNINHAIQGAEHMSRVHLMDEYRELVHFYKSVFIDDTEYGLLSALLFNVELMDYIPYRNTLVRGLSDCMIISLCNIGVKTKTASTLDLLPINMLILYTSVVAAGCVDLLFSNNYLINNLTNVSTFIQYRNLNTPVFKFVKMPDYIPLTYRSEIDFYTSISKNFDAIVQKSNALYAYHIKCNADRYRHLIQYLVNALINNAITAEHLMMMLIANSTPSTFNLLHLQENNNSSACGTITIFSDIIRGMIAIIAQHSTTFFTRFKNRIIKDGQVVFQMATDTTNAHTRDIENNDKATMDSLTPYIESFIFITLLQRINIASIFRIRVNSKLKTWYSPNEDVQLLPTPIGVMEPGVHRNQFLTTNYLNVMRDIQNAIRIIDSIAQNTAEPVDWFSSHRSSIIIA
jgi:hypothetical protein